jgi:hypothetical protein
MSPGFTAGLILGYCGWRASERVGSKNKYLLLSNNPLNHGKTNSINRHLTISLKKG